MNAINESPFAKVVVAFVVVGVTAMGVVSMVVTIMRFIHIDDFNGSFCIFAVDRCKNAGSADER
jgi:hypothetical protein